MTTHDIRPQDTEDFFGHVKTPEEMARAIFAAEDSAGTPSWMLPIPDFALLDAPVAEEISAVEDEPSLEGPPPWESGEIAVGEPNTVELVVDAVVDSPNVIEAPEGSVESLGNSFESEMSVPPVVLEERREPVPEEPMAQNVPAAQLARSLEPDLVSFLEDVEPVDDAAPTSWVAAVTSKPVPIDEVFDAMPIETTSVEIVAVEPAPAETALVYVAPTEVAPVDAESVESQSVEVAPVDAAPSYVVTVASTPLEAAPDEAALVEPMSFAASTVEALPIEVDTFEPAPVDAAPLEPVTCEPVSIEEAIIEPVPVDPMPFEAATVEEPVVSAEPTALYDDLAHTDDSTVSNPALDSDAYADLYSHLVDDPLDDVSEFLSGQSSEMSAAAAAWFDEPIGRHAKRSADEPSPAESARQLIAKGGYFNDEPAHRFFGRRRHHDG
ncbi:MAG TPA: hypothetical protein VHV57_05825 [Acidimicrobiales bacterium]|jgi:hypothetical protein|nr:hypothetical protein [Acidimicrobiales bacterium]